MTNTVSTGFASIRDAYVHGDPAVTGMLGGAPNRLWQSPPETRPLDGALAEAIRAFNVEMGAGERDLSGPVAVIATGHQPTLLTGPMYTVYKAVSAIQAARRVQEQHGVRCIPLFWIAGDDHDLEEAGTVYALTKKNEPLKLTYAPDGVEGRALDGVPLDGSLEALVRELAAAAPGSEFRDGVLEDLLTSLRASDCMTTWTARLLARLFRDTGLTLFVPSLRRARELAAGVIRQEIESPLESASRVNDAGQALETLGYPAQVVKGGQDCNFFYEHDGYRRKVTFEADRFVVAEASESFTQAELLAELEAHPERFSPNVILRCIVQQHLFPTASYVAGPGEINYWTQLGGVFEQFQLPMPVVYPRTSAVITNIKTNKLLSKFELAPGDLAHDPEQLIEQALAAQGADPLVQSLKQARATAVDALQSWQASAANQNNAVAIGEKLAERVAAEFDRAERALLRADEKKVETVRQQIERLSNTLMPLRKPQERMYTVYSYLFEYGYGVIDRFIRELDVDDFGLQAVEL